MSKSHDHKNDPNFTEFEDKPAVEVARKIEKHKKDENCNSEKNTCTNKEYSYQDKDKKNKEGQCEKAQNPKF